MVVDSIVVVAELPRTRNGKTDRRRLAAQATQTTQTQAAQAARPLAGVARQEGA